MSKVAMVFDCQGKEGWTSDAEIIVSHLNTPRDMYRVELKRSGEVEVNKMVYWLA